MKPAGVRRRIKPHGKRTEGSFVRKWGSEIARVGWVEVPSVLLYRQRAFDLNPRAFNVLVHLLVHWWYPDRPPFPSKATIAACMNVHPRTVQRALSEMRKFGYLSPRKRRGRGGRQTPEYLFDGLKRRAIKLAREEIADRQEKDKRDFERRRRKQPLRMSEKE